jgi:hypothetical protein
MSEALSDGTKIHGEPSRAMEDILKAMASGGCCLTGPVVITAILIRRNKISIQSLRLAPLETEDYQIAVPLFSYSFCQAIVAILVLFTIQSQVSRDMK